ncbi:MAG: hypothetical protein OXG98_01410 [Gemmatimonadetes bacterium]|nr:hypothetical protein [Gemmatimonadota bacterium]
MTYDDDFVAGGPNYAQRRLTRVEENTDSDVVAAVAHYYAYDGAGRLPRMWESHGNTLTAYTAAGNIKTHIVGDNAGRG